MIENKIGNSQINSEQPLKEVLDQYVKSVMKTYIPVFWIPYVGDKCIDKIMTSKVVNSVWGAYALLCLM